VSTVSTLAMFSYSRHRSLPVMMGTRQ